MMKAIKFIYLIILMLLNLQGNSQHYALYTQYMFNPIVINPAYAGSLEALTITAHSRRQWTNIEGSPSTTGLSGHTPIRDEKMGLGFIISNDKITITNQTSFNLIYAYHIPFSNKRKLFLGLQSGITHYNVNYSGLTSKTPDDPARATSDVNSWNPNFGLGAYYYSQKFYAGLSIPYLSSNILHTKNVSNQISVPNNYYFSTGYVITLSPDIKLKPNVLIKYVTGNPVQIDLNTNLLFKEVLWTGISFRSVNALSFLLQLNITEQLRFGYSYDKSIGALSGLSPGAHELIINYIFSFNKTRVDSPRYF